MIIKERKIKKPVITSEYINIYKPQPDVYKCQDTKSFRKGKFYNDWIANDFTVIHEKGVWHIYGITHPRPDGFISDYEYGDDTDIHEAEYQLFHCTAKGESFAEVFKSNTFKDEEKVLPACERPDEKPEIWAPYVNRVGDEYFMIYSPGVIRYAKSKDLYHWEKGCNLFGTDDSDARDPYLFCDDDGEKYLIYCEDDVVKCRKTKDLLEFEEEFVLQKNPFGRSSESPFMLKKDGIYYFMWCIWDGRNGMYDNRTYVFASETIDGFEGIAPLTMLEGHAPEFVTDGDDTYILSVFYPENGINAAKIEWK